MLLWTWLFIKQRDSRRVTFVFQVCSFCSELEWRLHQWHTPYLPWAEARERRFILYCALKMCRNGSVIWRDQFQSFVPAIANVLHPASRWLIPTTVNLALKSLIRLGHFLLVLQGLLELASNALCKQQLHTLTALLMYLKSELQYPCNSGSILTWSVLDFSDQSFT